MAKDVIPIEAPDFKGISGHRLSEDVPSALKKGSFTKFKVKWGLSVPAKHNRAIKDTLEYQLSADFRGNFSYPDFLKLNQAHTCAGFS